MSGESLPMLTKRFTTFQSAAPRTNEMSQPISAIGSPTTEVIPLWFCPQATPPLSPKTA